MTTQIKFDELYLCLKSAMFTTAICQKCVIYSKTFTFFLFSFNLLTFNSSRETEKASRELRYLKNHQKSQRKQTRKLNMHTPHTSLFFLNSHTLRKPMHAE